MNNDFDKLSELYKEDKNGFFEEKNRIIEEFISSLPEEKQQRMREYQKDIDAKLDKQPENNRITTINTMMNEQLSLMTSMIGTLKGIL